MYPFSNKDKNVFLINTENKVDAGALMARYSRSTNSMRDIWEKEFESNENRGKEFYQKVLAEYGDDSVAELGYESMALENISNIATSAIEDSRIGLSFLEKSSRYVKFSDYYIPRNIGNMIDQYKFACDFSMEIYNKSFEKMYKYLKEKYKLENLSFDESITDDMKVKIYNSSIKGKALDLTRGLLPVSVHTNLGISGNARAFEYLILKLKASPIDELQELGRKINNELNLTISPFLSRINTDYGLNTQDYIRKINKIIKEEYDIHKEEIIDKRNELNKKRSPFIDTTVVLLECDPPQILEMNILSSLLYDVIDEDIKTEDIIEWIRSLNLNQRRKLISKIILARTNRRDKLPRAFESSMIKFEIVSSYGAFRDLHRHRTLSFYRSKFNPHLNYTIPNEISEISMHHDFKDVMNRSKEVYNIMEKSIPYEAQYVLNFAYNYRYKLVLNIRELTHMLELRTTPQGNPEYRLICQKMYNEINTCNKFIIDIFKFIDLNTYELERLKSETRKEQKLNYLNRQS